MRILAIGDIHGCYRSLKVLEEYVPFTTDDLLVTLGDHIDKGPDSRSVIDWLVAYKLQGNLISLLGNHELMMLAADKSDRHFEEWMSWGGGKTLRSSGLSTANDQLNDVPESHWQFINSCRPFYETDSHFFVHANVYPHLSLEEQPRYMLYWDRFNDPPPHESERCMICGHTPQHDGVPRSVGHAICIDTWAHGGGWLTCLDVQSGQYWQANESQQTRNALIEINFYRVKKCGRSACFKIKFSL